MDKLSKGSAFLKDSDGNFIDPSIESLQFLDFPIEVARGNVTGATTIQSTGSNPGVGTVFEDVWDVGALCELDYDAQTGNFTPGLVLTGGTSGATAVIVTDVDAGTTGTLVIRKIVGTFQNDETITDSSTGSATSNGVISAILGLIYPTSGQTWEVICESANDTSAGTGARTIIAIFIEEATRAQTTEVVNLNGHTAVSFVSTDGFRLQSMAVVAWGSATNVVYGKTNLGTIVVRDSSTKNIMGSIAFADDIAGDANGLNSSQDPRFTVPAGKTLFIQSVLTNVTKNHDVTLRSLARLDVANGFLTVAEIGNYQDTTVQDISMAPIGLPEKADVKFIARSNNTVVGVGVQFIGILIDN